jgi:hypothetical protein
LGINALQESIITGSRKGSPGNLEALDIPAAIESDPVLNRASCFVDHCVKWDGYWILIEGVPRHDLGLGQRTREREFLPVARESSSDQPDRGHYNGFVDSQYLQRRLRVTF